STEPLHLVASRLDVVDAHVHVHGHNIVVLGHLLKGDGHGGTGTDDGVGAVLERHGVTSQFAIELDEPGGVRAAEGHVGESRFSCHGGDFGIVVVAEFRAAD